MPVETQYGWQCTLYGNGGTFAAPDWGEDGEDIKIVGDLQLDPAYGEVVIPTREAGGVQSFEPVILGVGITGKMRVDKSNATFVAWDAAFHAKTALDLLMLNGPKGVNGNRGYRMEFKLFTWKEVQGNGDLLMREFTLKPCLSTNPKQRAVVTGGNVVLTGL